MNVRFTRAAWRDVERTASWYEARREGLGVEFTNRVQEVAERISEGPLAHAKIVGEARRCRLKKFIDYSLWYSIVDDAIVIVCISSKRSPILIRERTLDITEIDPS